MDRQTRLARMMCQVEGCKETWVAIGDSYWRHVHRPHYICTCGMVGTSFNKHVSQQRRRGSTTDHQRRAVVTLKEVVTRSG